MLDGDLLRLGVDLVDDAFGEFLGKRTKAALAESRAAMPILIIAVFMLVTPFYGLLASDGDVAVHAGFIVAGDQAGELELAVGGELPDDLAGLAAGRRIEFGSSCSISGNFSMTALCSRILSS
ncbi:hypothetical protein AJ87_44835 [Rhizobium yanglingense]|nr:hypothetical protein AJ87_44835 [Rhizobium yanglingense]